MKWLVDLSDFLREIYRRRFVILELAKRDFQAKNKVSYLGSYWGYLEPIIFICILWFVFTIGLRANPAGKIPFFVFLACGLVPWLFFASTFGNLTRVIRQHAYLVRKGNFSIHILPICAMLSALVPHVSVLAVVLLLNALHGIYPSIYVLQTFYYITAMLCLLLGLGWITSSTSIFVNDVSNIVRISIQFGFWVTPIFWNISRVPAKFQWALKLNPMYYIVSGYRESLIYQVPFWSKPYEGLYFWVVTGTLMLIGSLVFKRLRPHFAELL